MTSRLAVFLLLVCLCRGSADKCRPSGVLQGAVLQGCCRRAVPGGTAGARVKTGGWLFSYIGSRVSQKCVNTIEQPPCHCHHWWHCIVLSSLYCSFFALHALAVHGFLLLSRGEYFIDSSPSIAIHQTTSRKGGISINIVHSQGRTSLKHCKIGKGCPKFISSVKKLLSLKLPVRC